MPQRAKVRRVCRFSQGSRRRRRAQQRCGRRWECRHRTGWHVAAVTGPIRDAALASRHLDHRLEPIEPARAVAHDLDGDAAGPVFRRSPGDLFRADGASAPASRGNEDARAHRPPSATIVESSFSSSSRPITSPSSIADGPRRRGRGKNGSSVEVDGRLVVPPMPSRSVELRWPSRSPIDWQASARQSFSTCGRPACHGSRGRR